MASRHEAHLLKTVLTLTRRFRHVKHPVLVLRLTSFSFGPERVADEEGGMHAIGGLVAGTLVYGGWPVRTHSGCGTVRINA